MRRPAKRESIVMALCVSSKLVAACSACLCSLVPCLDFALALGFDVGPPFAHHLALLRALQLCFDASVLVLLLRRGFALAFAALLF